MDAEEGEEEAAPATGKLKAANAYMQAVRAQARVASKRTLSKTSRNGRLLNGSAIAA
ncbi:hypothetical protein ULF88_05335 [Halopseudomonas pachastrellae]|nr:hypothetical protein [Halopseudomonas pachastrellae]